VRSKRALQGKPQWQQRAVIRLSRSSHGSFKGGRLTERERESIRNSFPQYSSETVAIDGIFRDINIDSRAEDLTILHADDGVCKAVFYGSDRQKHEVRVENGTLFIRITEEGKWYDRIAFFSSQKTGIELYLPQTQYSSLQIKGSTGDFFHVFNSTAFWQSVWLITINFGD